MGALLKFLVIVPHDAQVASEMQVGHASGAHPSTDMSHALTDLCLAHSSPASRAKQHGYTGISRTRRHVLWGRGWSSQYVIIASQQPGRPGRLRSFREGTILGA
jgi:hypothetical protein